MTRFLVPSERGVYFLTVLAASIMVLLCELGATMAALTFAATGRIAPQKLHGLALGVTAFAAVAGAAVLVGGQPFWSRTVLGGVDRGDLILASAAIVPVLYAQVCGGLLTGLGRIPELSRARTIAAIVAPAIVLPAVWISHSSRWAIATWLISATVYAGLVAGVLLRARLRPARPSRRETRELIGFGTRGQVGTISHQGFLRLDVLFLSARSGPAVVGWYSLASVIAEKLALVGSAVYSASALQVGRLPREDSARLVARLVRAVLIVLVPAGLVLAIVAHPLVTIVFGQDYAAAVNPLRLLIPGTVCLVLWYLVSLYIVTGLGRPGLTTFIQAGAVAVSIPLYYFAVRSHQMIGAAVASSIVYGLLLAVGVIVFLRTTGLSIRLLWPRAADLRGLIAYPLSFRRARA